MDVWQMIWKTVLSEFSEISDLDQITRIILRFTLAATLGGLLGYDREQKGRAAGLRTHMLVSLGAALFVLIPQQTGASIADLTRVVQGLAAGVGFLGAGSIIMGRQQEDTKGMTTARASG
jgi:putative Mg2+ transporter-C (MgtC) family protein